MEGLSDDGDKERALLDLVSLYSSVSSSSSVTANTLRHEFLRLSDLSVPGVAFLIFTSFEETEVLPFSRADNLPCILASLSSISNKGSEEDLSEDSVVTDEVAEVEAGVVEGGSSGPSKESSKSLEISLDFFSWYAFFAFNFFFWSEEN